METKSKPSIATSIKTKAQAHAAALRHGQPGKKMRVVLVTGPDGALATIAYLAAMLRAANEHVGVLSQHYIQIDQERVNGSDQADVLGDASRLQATLAHMRRAGCRWALIEVPPVLPPHQFVGIEPAMLVVRRCGDAYLDAVTISARKAMVQLLLMRKPAHVVLNGDDPCSADELNVSPGELTMTYGTGHRAECRITRVQLHPKGAGVRVLIDHQTEVELATSATGKTAIYSMVAAATAAYLLHQPLESIKRGALDTDDTVAFSQFIPVARPYHIAYDTNSTPAGIAEVVETFKHFAKNRLIVVLGSPLGQPAGWRPTVGETAARAADRLIVTDGECAAHESPSRVREQLMQGVIQAEAEARTEEVPDRQTGIEKALSIARRGDIVLLIATTPRPYRQLGTERVVWSDKKKIEEILG